MSSDDVAIRLRNISKHYLLFARPQDRLKQSIVPRLQRLAGRQPAEYYRNFAALSDVSFEVRRGETVGIIGRNGSGKSTLLQVICGILWPNSGAVEVKGRIAALLELGAGFNAEFTGRENVYMNGAILGLSKAEIEARFDGIAAFADIGEFIEQPVKTYSSGMYVRLAFAVAVCVDPDILVVDEALAVGDEAFQRKCFARIEDMQAKGATILFVSHGAQTIVQLCSRALLIDGGELLLDGRPKAVVGQYQRLVNLTGDEARKVREQIRLGEKARAEDITANMTHGAPNGHGVANGHESDGTLAASGATAEGYDPNLVSLSRVEYESHGAVIRDLHLLNSRGEQVNILEMGRRYSYEYVVDFHVEAREVGFGMLANTTSGLGIAGATTTYSRALRTRRVEAGSTARVRFEFDCSLLPGTYFLNAGVLATDNGSERYLHRVLDGLAFRVAVADELVATSFVDLGVRPHVVISRPQVSRHYITAEPGSTA